MARERTVVKGIVLRAVDTKESDKILTILTSAGKVPVVAKGARSRKSRVTACTQLLAYSELTLSESHGWQYLSEGSTIELFEGVRRDIELLSLASYFAELTEAAALEAVEAGRDVVMLYPREGTSVVTDGLAVIRGCAHEENARQFIDFALGADVQRYVARECLRRPVRADLLQPAEETEGLVPMEYDLVRAAAEREAILARWRELEEAS